MPRLLVLAGSAITLAGLFACSTNSPASDFELSPDAEEFPCSLIEPREAVDLMGEKLAFDQPTADGKGMCYIDGVDPGPDVVRPTIRLEVLDHRRADANSNLEPGGGVSGRRTKEVSSLGDQAAFSYLREDWAEVEFVIEREDQVWHVFLHLFRYDEPPQQDSMVDVARKIARRLEQQN